MQAIVSRRRASRNRVWCGAASLFLGSVGVLLYLLWSRVLGPQSSSQGLRRAGSLLWRPHSAIASDGVEGADRDDDDAADASGPSLDECIDVLTASSGLQPWEMLERVALVDLGDVGAGAPGLFLDARFQRHLQFLQWSGFSVMLLWTGGEGGPDDTATRAAFDGWVSRMGASAAGGNSSVPRSALLAVSSGCAGAYGPPLVGVSWASRRGADTLLWARWAEDSTGGLSDFLRYYGPTAALPVLPEEHSPEGASFLRHFALPSGGGSAWGGGAAPLELCVPGVALPILQVGMCPQGATFGEGGYLSEAVGVLLPPRGGALSAAAEAIARGPHVVLAYRPGFAALVHLAATARRGPPAPRDTSRVLAAAATALGEAGYSVAVLPPGALCGDSSAPYGGERPPDIVRSAQHPHFSRRCLVAGCWPAARQALGADGSCAEGGPPPCAYAPGSSGVPTAAALLQRIGALGGSRVPLSVLAEWVAAIPARFPCAPGAPAPCAPTSIAPPLLPAPGQLGEFDADSLASVERHCFTSRPWARDILLAVNILHAPSATPERVRALRALYGRFFPLIVAFADAPDDLSAAMFRCDSTHHSGHVCFARAAPFAFGRAGVLYVTEDTLLAPWRLANMDARGLWFSQRQAQMPGKLGLMAGWDVPETAARYVGKDTADAIKAALYDSGLIAGRHADMQVRNALHFGQGVHVIRGAADAVFVPRALTGFFAQLTQPAVSAGLFYECVMPIAGLASAYAPDVQPIEIRERFIPGSLAPRKPEDEPWSYTDALIHPWPLLTSEGTLRGTMQRFDAWYEAPPKCDPAAHTSWQRNACVPPAPFGPGDAWTIYESVNPGG